MDSKLNKAIGVAFDGRASLLDLAQQAQIAEAAGAQTLWIACHLFLRDPITSAHKVLSTTETIKVALMALSPYSMHPVMIAMSAVALEELFPGRVILCLGVGAPGDLAAAGIQSPKPLSTLRESITLCRALFRGETLSHHGNIFQVQGRSLANPAPNIPIVLAASGEKMLEMGGALCDGVLLSAATSTPFLNQCLSFIKKGESYRKIDTPCAKMAIVYTSLNHDYQVALQDIRQKLGFILRGTHHAQNIELANTNLNQAALWDAYLASDWHTVENLITNEVISAHAAAGDSETVKKRYLEYRSLGLDELIIGGIDDSLGIKNALEILTSN